MKGQEGWRHSPEKMVRFQSSGLFLHREEISQNPVSQGTLRIVKVFWGLDAGLARQRHFPAINWLSSYSLYPQALDQWYRDNIANDFPEVRTEISTLLQVEAELQEIVQLVGSDALPIDQQLTLEVARMIGSSSSNRMLSMMSTHLAT